jgi:uncharacterized protein YdiU (UPF0061 family)
VQLANALYPLIKRAEPLEQALKTYTATFEQGWQAMIAGKMGLLSFDAASDEALAADLFKLLETAETDMTWFFRGLSDFSLDHTAAEFYTFLEDCSYTPLTDTTKDLAQTWLTVYQTRIALDNRPDAERRAAMLAVNPRYVLRNYLAQQAIDQAEQGDFGLVRELLDVLRNPYAEQPEKSQFAAKRPDWAKQRAGCSMLSCSS